MKPPGGLGAAGKALWKSVTQALPEAWEFDDREQEVLTLAAHQADDVAALERAIKRDGLVVTGSVGQVRLNPAVVEVRQGRLAIARLLGQLSLPDDEGKTSTAASERGRRAAQARWSQHAERTKQRRQARGPA